MTLIAENTKRWNAMHVKPNALSSANGFARRALANKPLYQRIADRIHRENNKHFIPWWAIALIHERECVGGTTNYKCSIGQGSPWNVKSKIKPYSGPFASFEDAAVDSLVVQAPNAALNDNWSGGGTLTLLERYNGLGYARMGRPSPYVWSKTDQYVKGKYISDGHYCANKVDDQLGVAVLLQALMSLDPSISLDGNHPGQTDTPRGQETTVVGTTAASILAAINALNPYYDLSWWDITGIIVAGFTLVTFIVYKINQAKKGQV